MAKHLVLDIETLGVEYGSQLLSIGAVCGNSTFEVKRIWTPDFYGAKIDFKTLEWWMTTPSQKARDDVFKGITTAHCDAIDDFRKFIERTKPDYLWGNSPDFDFGHLEYWYKKASKNVPWTFWQLRDIRTIRDFVDPAKVAEIKAKYTPHIALDDAKCEYEILQEFLKQQENYLLS